LFACAALAVCAANAFAQPAFFEPKEHYYKAKGQAIRVKWEIEPKAVVVNGELTATLVITGVQNAPEVQKPDLRKLRSFDNFQITESQESRDATAKEVRFAYKLSPRTTAIREVPSLKFHYFNPAAASGPRQFPATVADAVPITVSEPPKPVRVPTPLEAPDYLFSTATGPSVLHNAPFVPCQWAWLAAAVFGPLAGFAWFLVWRRMYPDAARLAQMRRSRAARKATDAIRKSHRANDPAGTIATALLGYLRTRFLLPEHAVTPSELATTLAELRVPANAVEHTVAVFRDCDRARFAPPADNAVSLAANAEAAIAQLEALA
jgi:hypothetical protein